MQRLIVTLAVLIVIGLIAAFVWRGKIPWHKIGQCLKSAEALAAAGFIILVSAIFSLNQYMSNMGQYEAQTVKASDITCRERLFDSFVDAHILVTNRSYVVSKINLEECADLVDLGNKGDLLLEVEMSPSLLDRFNGYERATRSNLKVKSWTME